MMDNGDWFDQDSSGPFRARSNTWPLPRPGDQFDADPDPGSDKGSSLGPIGENGEPDTIPTTANDLGLDHGLDLGHQSPGSQLSGPTGLGATPGSGGPKKNTSRRNAWGNMSYADLITQAIQSSPDKRLTLSQIYDWMVQNVPYFKDKGDSNSSAGWKNSIRHNLSLHNRFMRVQNEGTGKSSWWMINPDAKPGKAARRRATSMETSKYEKKRGRVKKKVEALRNAAALQQLEQGQLGTGAGIGSTNNINNNTTSPSSSVSEGLDVFPESPIHHFQLGQESFRPRAASNASSCGRLSPIPASESDMHDSQVPPLSPLASWPYSTSDHLPEQYNSEQLVEMANSHMKLGNGNRQQHAYLGMTKSSPTERLSPANLTPLPSAATFSALSSGSFVPQTISVNGSSGYSENIGGTLPRNGSDPYFQNPDSIQNSITLTTLNSKNGPRSNSRTSLLSCGSSELTPNNSFSLSPSESMDTLTVVSASSYHSSPQHQQAQLLACHPLSAKTRGAYSSGLEGSLMRTMGAPKSACGGGGSSDNLCTHLPVSNSSATSLGATASQVMGHLLSLNNHPAGQMAMPMPSDLDFEGLQGGLECDVDQVIRHELSVEGNLDFNFDLHGSSACAAR